MIPTSRVPSLGAGNDWASPRAVVPAVTGSRDANDTRAHHPATLRGLPAIPAPVARALSASPSFLSLLLRATLRAIVIFFLF